MKPLGFEPNEEFGDEDGIDNYRPEGFGYWKQPDFSLTTKAEAKAQKAAEWAAGRLAREDSQNKICPVCNRVYAPKLRRKHPEVPINKEFPGAKRALWEQHLTGICSNTCWGKHIGVYQLKRHP
jgi:hypothetical protein